MDPLDNQSGATVGVAAPSCLVLLPHRLKGGAQPYASHTHTHPFKTPACATTMMLNGRLFSASGRQCVRTISSMPPKRALAAAMLHAEPARGERQPTDQELLQVCAKTVGGEASLDSHASMMNSNHTCTGPLSRCSGRVQAREPCQ